MEFKSFNVVEIYEISILGKWAIFSFRLLLNICIFSIYTNMGYISYTK